MSFRDAALEYDLREDPSLGDDEPAPTADDYWNGLDEREDDE